MPVVRLLLTAALALAALPADAQGSFDPGDVLNRMGEPWTAAKPYLPAPDSGRVVGKTGDLLWVAPDEEVDAIRLSIRGGVLARVVVATSVEGRREFDEISDQLRQMVGPPGADGFYSADQLRQMDAPMAVPFDLSLDPDAGVMIVRLAEGD